MQQALANQNNAQNANQANINNANAQLASTSMQGQQGLIGGLLGGAGMALGASGLFGAGGAAAAGGGGAAAAAPIAAAAIAHGGEVPTQDKLQKMAVGGFLNGWAGGPENISPGGSGPASGAGQFMNGMGNSSGGQSLNQGLSSFGKGLGSFLNKGSNSSTDAATSDQSSYGDMLSAMGAAWGPSCRRCPSQSWHSVGDNRNRRSHTNRASCFAADESGEWWHFVWRYGWGIAGSQRRTD